MLGIACGKNAMVSRAPRKLTWVRTTTQDTNTLSNIVAVGTAIIRIAVLINGSASTKSKIVKKLFSEICSQASAEGNCRCGSNDAHNSTRNGMNTSMQR